MSARTPANRSSSGVGTSITERASSYSSVGHTFCWISSGTRNQKPSGSTWVACARRASSRTPKYAPHSIRVVILSPRSGRSSERSSHSWFVLHELLGYNRVRNYDGSWTEYGSLIGVPIEKPAPVTAS